MNKLQAEISQKFNMGSEYYLKHPREQFFYRFIIFVLTLMSLENQTTWGYDPPSKLVLINSFTVRTFAPVCFVTQFIYLYAYRSDLDFDILGIIFCIIPVTFLANVNVVSSRFTSYKSLMRNFMSQIHLHNRLYKYKNIYLEKKILVVERLTRCTALYLILSFCLGWVAWIWIPVMNNMKNVEEIHNRTRQLQTCIYMWMPFDYKYNYRNWVVTHLFNAYAVLSGVVLMAFFHTLNYMFIYHLIGHIQILKYNIKTEFSGRLSDDEAREKLVDVIQYHDFILGVFSDVQSAFGFNITTNYLHNLVADSLLIFQMMYGGKDNILMYLILVIVYMGGLIVMSFVLEEIRRESEDLCDVMYSIPWERMSVRNQRYLPLIIQRMQPPLIFKALGGFIAGVRPMISIIKTTFSYYVMLESTMGKE